MIFIEIFASSVTIYLVQACQALYITFWSVYLLDSFRFTLAF